jgi:hypothetical protein
MKLREKAPKAETPKIKVDSRNEISKEKEVLLSPKTEVSMKYSNPVTRSSASKKSVDVQRQLVEIERPHTSHGEGEKATKWLNKQLREAQNQIIQLKEEKRISEDIFIKHFKE